jgi:hypothetical protein
MIFFWSGTSSKPGNRMVTSSAATPATLVFFVSYWIGKGVPSSLNNPCVPSMAFAELSSKRGASVTWTTPIRVPTSPPPPLSVLTM